MTMEQTHTDSPNLLLPGCTSTKRDFSPTQSKRPTKLAVLTLALDSYSSSTKVVVKLVGNPGV
ncbi:hypothetical protein PI124_g18734 [Phytophthora idaei]|nr:hypothetical protein PI125_g20240 [Phytophthora idaei]KAG3134547.1 hypothetical protein PI126_g18644 [Phytophthora idaei]KAG3236252.1 hypothetical protein PI124_g18734 [Phytophthora idaei]